MSTAPRTHEVRIHGVHNTPPANMLAVAPDEVAESPVAGDDSAGFWAPKPSVALPPGVATREAYSWGNLTSDPKAKGWRTAGARAAWLVLLPYALVNVGYWTRAVRRPGEPRTYGALGAALFRFAGLLMTALFVTTAAEIGVALIAWQCYAPGRSCSSLPSFLGFLRDQPAGRRIAGGLAVPLLVLLVLWLVSRKSMQLYEEVPDDAPDVAGQETHLLERARFWSGRDRVLRLQRLHLAFGLGLVVAVTAWPAWRVADPGTGLLPGWAQPWFPVDFLLAAALLAAVAVTCVAHTGDAPEYDGMRGRASRIPGWLLFAALALTASHVASLLVVRLKPDGRYGDLPGAGAVPVVLTVALVTTVLLALTLRSATQWLTVLAFGAAVGIGWATDASGRTDAWAFVPAAATLAVGWAIHRARRTRDGNQWRGWGGDAPAMLLGLGVLLALIWATAATLLVADRLNGDAKVWTIHSTTAGGDDAEYGGAAPGAAPAGPRCAAATFSPEKVEVTCTPGAQPPPLALPLFYFWIAPALLAAMLAWLPVAIASYVRRRKVALDQVRADYGIAPYLVPVAPPPAAPAAAGDAEPGGLLGWLARLLRALLSWLTGAPATAVTAPPAAPVPTVAAPRLPTAAERHQLEQVRGVRTLARFSHRAERVAGLCGPATALFVLLAVAGALTGREPKHFHVPNWTIAAGQWALGLLALGLLALGALMYKDGKARVSVAVFWDLASFWPRTAHPFAPPCYAERAVPDLTYRVRYRLAGGDRVVLSAHSLGAVLAVATFFRIDPVDRSRLALLTYGTQLRAYFGRLFPEVLGPAVLGHSPLAQARMSKASEVATPSPGPATMAGQLGVDGTPGHGRWLSLFRRSDYLGFAVYDEPDNAVDHHTLETRIPWTDGDPKPPPIDSHGDYPRTPEYDAALTDLLGRF